MCHESKCNTACAMSSLTTCSICSMQACEVLPGTALCQDHCSAWQIPAQPAPPQAAFKPAPAGITSKICGVTNPPCPTKRNHTPSLLTHPGFPRSRYTAVQRCGLLVGSSPTARPHLGLHHRQCDLLLRHSECHLSRGLEVRALCILGQQTSVSSSGMLALQLATRCTSCIYYNKPDSGVCKRHIVVQKHRVDTGACGCATSRAWLRGHK